MTRTVAGAAGCHVRGMVLKCGLSSTGIETGFHRTKVLPEFTYLLIESKCNSLLRILCINSYVSW